MLKRLWFELRLLWAMTVVLCECIKNEIHDVPDILED